MQRAIKLNEKEKGSIEAYRSCGMTIREIAEHLQRSITVVHNYIKMGSTYCSQKRTGRVSKISGKDKRNIISVATKKKCSASKIKTDLQLPISTCRVTAIFLD